jgi:putative membrane protein
MKTKEVLKKALEVTPDFENKKEIILRDFLALERTKLANERTLLAYLRGSIYLILGGVAFLQLEGFDSIKWLGPVTLILAVAFMVLGVFRFFYLKRRLKTFYKEAHSEKMND